MRPTPCTSASPTKPSASGRRRVVESYLNVPADHRRGGDLRRRRGAPGLRVPLGERGLRGHLHAVRPDVHRADRGRHAAVGPEGPGPGPAQEPRAAAPPRDRRSCRTRTRSGRGRGDRVPGHPQGVGRRRRARHEDRPGRRDAARVFPQAQARRSPASRTATSTSSATSRSRGTSSSRSSPTARARSGPRRARVKRRHQKLRKPPASRSSGPRARPSSGPCRERLPLGRDRGVEARASTSWRAWRSRTSSAATSPP